VTAGLVLRTLAAGAPLVLDPLTPAAASLTGWLEAAGMPAPRSAEETLEAALDHTPWVRAACARGVALAAQHDPAALATRLDGRRGRGEGPTREAA
jgi:hypothetical protein